jgi:hypothetical protein
MVKQYRVVYTLSGEGYTKEHPWIYDNADSKEEAIELMAEADEWISANYRDYEVWIEEGEKPAWHRVDLG